MIFPKSVASIKIVGEPAWTRVACIFQIFSFSKCNMSTGSPVGKSRDSSPKPGSKKSISIFEAGWSTPSI